MISMQDEKMFEYIKSLCTLQETLLLEFKKTFSQVVDLNELSDSPNQGKIYIDGSDWDFFKHGIGLLFKRQNDGLVVDMHEYFDSPNLFDSWRLMQFLNSFGHSCKQLEIDDVLQKLIQRGKIKTVTDVRNHFEIV